MSNRRKLYDALVKDYDMGTFEQFESDIQDETKRKKLFDAISNEYDMGTYDQFSEQLLDGPTAASDGSVGITEPKEEESRFGILGKMGQYMGSPSAYVPMPQAEEREELTQAEIDQRAAMRQMLQDSGTIDRMEEMEKEARKNKFKAFGEALAYTPQVSSFGVSSNIYKDTEEQLADAQRAMEASAEHRQNKAMEQTLDVALDKARAGEWGGIGENNVGNGIFDFGLGLWDSATRMSTWDFGVSDTLNGLTIAQVVKKWEKDPESLTATERNLLDAMGMATAVQEAYQDQVGIGYAVGESLPQSAGFMASMYLNPASGLGKSLARKAVREYGKQSIKKNLYRIGGDFLETAIMTGTTGAGRVVADALERINGQSTYEIDPKTGIVMYGGQEDQKTVGEAVVKAIGSNFIENYSEALGEYFDPLLGMSRRLAAGGLRKMNLDKWADALSDVQPSQMAASIRSLREKAKFGGVFGEIMEEEVGMALNAITVGDYTFSKEEADASKGKKQWIFDLENQLTAALSCAIMSGALTGVETIGNVRYRREMEKSVADAEKAARAAVGDEMIAQIDQASPEGMVDILRDAYMDQNLSLQQKRALAEYATQRVRMQYYNAADAKARRQVNVAQQNTIDAYEAGRHAQLPQYYNIDQEYRRSEAAINERENAEEIWDAIRLMNNMDENERQNIMRDFSEEDQELIRNWRYNAYRWQGAINHRAEQVEDLVDEYIGQVTPYTRPDGTLTTAILGDDVVYVMNEAENGDAVVYTNDGRKMFCKMRDLEHVQQHNAEELIDRFRQQTTEVVNQETEKNLSYPSEVKEPVEGVTVETLDGKQWQVAATDGENVEIVGLVFDKKSGQWIPNSGDYRKMTREQFMDWQKSELDRKKANTYEQGDKLTFYVNGEPISAEITGIDPDGNYYVHVSNLVEGLDKAVSDVYTAEELRKLTTPSSKVSEKTTENESTLSEEIKQSVSEEVTNSQKGNGNRRPLTSEEAITIVPRMAQMAETAVDLELTPENWVAEFGEDGVVPTPIGDVKMGENQYLKLLKKKRQSYFGMVKPTLTNPDIILEEYDPADGAERETKLLFVKTFVKPDGSRTVNFESVTVKKGDLEVSISSHEIDSEALMKKVQQDDLIHLNKKFLSSEMRLTEPQQEGSDLVPSPNSNLSNTKGSGNVSDMQGNGQENVVEGANVDASTNKSAYARVPKDAKGNPLYEQTDADTAWDAIMEQTEGDAEMAQRIAEEMVADKKAALTKMQKGKPKHGATVAEKIANEKAHIAAIAQAEQEVAAWEKIAQTEARRREAAMSEADRYAAEMEQKNISEGLSALGEPQSLQEYVLAQLAGGAYKLRWNDKENGTKGFGSHTGLSTEEMKARLSMVDNKNGLTPEEIAHSIVENMDASFGEVDVMDVTDMVIDAVSTYASRRAMLNGMVKSRAELIRQQEIAEQEAKDAWYMEQYHATEEELAAYNEYLAEFAEEIYGEDVDYEQRIATFAEIQLEYDNQGTDAGLRSSADQGEGLTSDREGGRSVGETEQLDRREVFADAAGVAEAEDGRAGGSVSAQSDDRAARIAGYRNLSEAIAAEGAGNLTDEEIDDIIGREHEDDERLEREGPVYTEERLDNGDVRITGTRSNGEVASVSIERNGKVIQVDTYEDGALFERTDYDANGNAAKVTRYKDGEVVSEQEYKDGKRKVTANYFEMAEEAQKKRKSKKKSNDKLAEKNHQEERKEGAATTGTGKSRPSGTFSVSYYTQYFKELFRKAHWGERPSEEVAGIIRRHNAGKTLLAHTEDEREFLSVLRALTNNNIQDELSNINNALQSDEYTDEEKEELKRAKNLITRFVNRGERNAVIEALTGAKLGEKLPLSKIDELFEMYNSDANVAELYARVRAIAEQIGLDFWFEEMEDRQLGGYLHSDNRVRLNAHMLYCPRMQRQGVASTIVHEMLHAVAGYAVYTQKDIKLGLTPKVQLSKQVLSAANTIINIYEKTVKGNPALVHQEYDIEKEEWIEVADYGTTSVHEMLSEISNPEFRDKLKQIEYNGRSVWQRIWDAIKSMFTQSSDVTSPTAYDSMAKALDVLINEFSVDAYQKYSGLEESAARAYHGSGALFDRFDHSFMGSGEGNQALGWGTYVSEAEGVGKTYADIAAQHNDGRILKHDYERAKDKYDYYKEYAAKLEERGEKQDASNMSSFIKLLAEDLKEAESRLRSFKEKHGRVLYDVEIPDNNGSNYLEWYENAPKEVLAKAKGKLYDILVEGDYKGAERELERELDDLFALEQTGQNLYGSISAYLGSDKEASQFLHEMGYVGLKYPTNTLHGGNIDGTSNYVIFDENDLEIVDNIRFRDGAPFFSNAERAVENIKQNKATPEQWLAMIKKDGGLKAGEDKWMGLSDWLNEQKEKDVKTLTKDEVLQFIRENQIEIEEVEYGNNPVGFNELKEEYEAMLRDEGYDAAHDAMIDRYGDDFDIAFEDLGGELAIVNEEAAAVLLGSENIINSTRLEYTTEGLENKREIALVVPTIEPWNQSDTIHFGDAGDGRAVAWVRFGETTDEDGNRVLVIDEVQSKRHDEGRAKGYQSKEKGDLLAERDRLYDKMYRDGLTEEEFNRRNEINARLEELGEGRIPDAPFDKNYHELVMKRMLRYAAENGFDKVAWTKGKQQAERYNLAKRYDYFEREDNPNEEGRRFVFASHANADVFRVNDEGVVIGASIEEAKGKTLASVVGSELAEQMMSLENGDIIDKKDIVVGGEGMKGYYDEMIPRFMNKYVKKWGTKVGEVTLPNVEKAGRTMWSVDVTPEMKESVMQGQPMFREGMGAISDREVSYENDPIAKFQGKPRYYGKRAAAFAERERARMQKGVEEAAKILGLEVEIITDASTLQGRKAKAKGWYDINSKKVVVVVPNHVSKGDAVRTVLHEGVAHHGLRELFGDGFDAMLDNIYNNVAPELKARIDAIAERTGVSTSVATEEYLASLSEETSFEEAKNMGWWAKIKNYFVKMLNKLGMPGLNLKEEITDNELRFLLWRSYQNLVDPNRYLKPLGYLDDVAKQKELKVGNYAENTMATPKAAEMSEAEEWSAVTMQRIEELEAQAAQLENEIAEMESKRDADDASRYEMWDGLMMPIRMQLEDTYSEIEGLYALSGEEEVNEEEREAEKQRQLYEKRIDNAYLKAAREGNWEEATDLFRQYVLSKAEDEGIVPMDYGVGYRGGAHSSIAKKVKEENPDAIAEAAYQMSVRIPKGSILVPMPSRTGNATYTVKLAEAIAKATGSEVRDVLKGKARMSVYEAKQKGIKMTPEDLGMYTTEELPKGKNIVIIDNVIDKGTTALAAVSAVKGASVVAYAYTLGDKQRAATLKLAEPVTYDDNKRIIPLSQRFDKETDDIRYRLVDDPAEIVAEVEREAGALGVPVRIVRSVDELPDEDTRKRAVDGQLKGYFDPRTGEVVVYEPNTDNANDAKRTVLHEIVGHKGLRQLIGEERYDKAMVQLMYMLPSEVRDAVLRRAEHHGWNAAIAMDEYLAEQAERDVQPTWWGKVNAKIRALLRNMGFNVRLTDADVTYLLWRSRKKLMGDTAFDMATNAILKQAARKSVDYDAKSDNAIRHRGVEQGKKISEAVSDYYEKYTATTNADKFWGGVKYMATHLGDGGTRALLNDLSESQFEDIRSVRVLEEAIESAEGKPLRENEMIHKSLNAKTSRDARDMDKSQSRYFQPMAKLLGKILGKKIDGRKIEIDDVERYLICKHSPENNEFLMKRAHSENRRKKIHERAKELMKGAMTEEEAIAQATSEYILHQSDFRDDYSGLTELFLDDMVREAKIAERTKELMSNGVTEDTATQMAIDEFAEYKPTLEDRERMAADEVARFEAAVDGLHEELWGIINGINRDTIERLFRSGLISRSLYNDLKKRHKFYVPLSGWKNDAAADIYNYAMYGFDGTPIQTVIKKAFGTKYQARNILGSMFAMNMAAITEGNQNLVKQKLYNLALNHDTGVLQIVDLWEVKDGEGDAAEWKPAPKPELRPTMSDAEMQKALTDYQNKLMEMEKDGKARKAVNSLADNFGKHATDKEAKRHHVELLVNGRKVVIWVNGNPKLAQAINGDLKVKKELLFFNNAVDNANRFLAQVQTSLNPEFMISNFERDILSASRYNLIKYGPKYEASFMKHLAQLIPIVSETNADMRSDVWGGAGIFNLFALDRNTNNPNRKPDAQVLDMNNPLHREFVNFLNYGGKTGYVERKQAEDLQQRIKKLSKREQSIIRKYPAGVAGWAVDTIEHLNEGIENATRFAAYLTARERGKSVTEAVFEAKEVSVNFNMQGSGAWGNASYRKLYNYFNVGLQSLRREKNLGREFPKAYIANLSFMMALGAISTVLLTADWDGDDEDEYMGLSDFNRYNYINVKTENGFIHYSLPQDLRAFYAIGCISTEWAMGKIDGSRAMQAYATQANNYTPLSFVSSTIDREPDSNPVKNLAMSFVPSAAVSVAEIAVNEDFLGRRIHNQNQWNEYEPEWQRAGYRTPEWVINASKTLSEAGGGTEHKRGVWFTEINPSNAWHIMDSYGGGLLDFAQKTYNLVEREFAGKEHELRDYPMVSKFYVESGQDYSKQRVVNDRYRMYREDYETIDNELNGYLKDKSNALGKLSVRAKEEGLPKSVVNKERAEIEKVYSENVKRVSESPNYWIYETFAPYEKGYNKLDRNLGEARKYGSEQTEKELSGEMYNVRKKVVDEIDAKRERPIDRLRQWLGN